MRTLFFILLPFLPIHILVFYLSYTGAKDEYVFTAVIAQTIVAGIVSKLKTKKISESIFFWIVLTIVHICISFILVLSTMFLPGSKEHNYVMYSVCLPAMKAYYGLSEKQSFPENGVDKDGLGKWWYQHSECEKNVRAGKGPVFSENPAGFIPVIQ